MATTEQSGLAEALSAFPERAEARFDTLRKPLAKIAAKLPPLRSGVDVEEDRFYLEAVQSNIAKGQLSKKRRRDALKEASRAAGAAKEPGLSPTPRLSKLCGCNDLSCDLRT
eukprot:scaffold7352_cov254-Pinguiococcus_pyrenoidosus.AAC.11